MQQLLSCAQGAWMYGRFRKAPQGLLSLGTPGLEGLHPALVSKAEFYKVQRRALCYHPQPDKVIDGCPGRLTLGRTGSPIHGLNTWHRTASSEEPRHAKANWRHVLSDTDCLSHVKYAL